MTGEPSGRATPDQRQRLSSAIAIARVLCILGVVYVHAWTGLSGHDLQIARGTFQENVRWVLMEGFGRSAVPLLGIISGWLVARSRTTPDWVLHIRRKARTILVPMIAWNLIAVVLVSGSAMLFDLPAPRLSSFGWLLEEVLILTRNPDIDVQMPFLRDLFVCMLFAPLLVRWPLRAIATVALVAGAAQIFGWGWPLLLRPSILAFFAVGIAASRCGWAQRIGTWAPIAAALPFALLLPIKLALEFSLADAGALPAFIAFDLAVRLAAAVAFWRLAWGLADSDASRRLLAMEPYAFFLFCAHLVLIWLFGPIIGMLTGPLGSPLYLPFLVLQPFLVLAAAVAIARFVRAVSPAAARLLSGGRLTDRPA